MRARARRAYFFSSPVLDRSAVPVPPSLAFSSSASRMCSCSVGSVCAAKLFRSGRALELSSEMCDLCQRVDARVRAPRPVQFHFGLKEIFGRPAHLARDGSRVDLFLPAAVACTVVLERDLPGF